LRFFREQDEIGRLAPDQDLCIRRSKRRCLGIAHTPDFEVGSGIQEIAPQPSGDVFIKQVSDDHGYTGA